MREHYGWMSTQADGQNCCINIQGFLKVFRNARFYINIYGFTIRGKSLHEIRVLDNTYLRFKVQLPTSASTEITAGGHKNILKNTLEGPVPLHDAAEKNYTLNKYMTTVAVLGFSFFFGGGAHN